MLEPVRIIGWCLVTMLMVMPEQVPRGWWLSMYGIGWIAVEGLAWWSER